jgi:hypothetical protein
MTAPAEPPAADAPPGETTPATVSSGGSASPPRRSRRDRAGSNDGAADTKRSSGRSNSQSGNRSGNDSSRRSASSVSATVAAPAPVAVPFEELPAEAELSEDDTGQTTRSRRKSKPAKQLKQPKPVQQAKTRPVATGPRSERRFRQTVMKVDLWTVLKLSLCFYLSLMFIILIAIVALWMIAEAAGIIGSVEKFFGDLLSAQDFTFLSGEVLRGAILVSLVVVALQVVITVIAASFYNIFAELFGGLEITIKEQDAGER